MTTIFILLLLFLLVGISVRKYDNTARFMLITVIVGVIVYLNITK